MNNYPLPYRIWLIAVVIGATTIAISTAFESKAEAALRLQLERTDAALRLAQKQRDDAEIAYKKLQSQALAQAASAIRTGKSLSQTALGVAQDAQSAAAANAEAAQLAFEEQKAELAAAKQQISSGNQTLLITQVFGFLTVIVGFAFKAWSDSRERVAAKEDARELREQVAGAKQAIVQTASDIALLEKNTNAMKDALVKVTGEAAFAKGHKEAEDQGRKIAEALVTPAGQSPTKSSNQPTHHQIDRIEQTGEDTNEKATNIETRLGDRVEKVEERLDAGVPPVLDSPPRKP